MRSSATVFGIQFEFAISVDICGSWQVQGNGRQSRGRRRINTMTFSVKGPQSHGTALQSVANNFFDFSVAGSYATTGAGVGSSS
jgi:hypothetical protein